MNKNKREMVERVLKALSTCLLVLGFIYVILLGVELDINLLTIKNNTDILEKDNSAIKVENINSKEEVFLENGKSLENSDIEAYVKIIPEEGTWYIEDEKLLAVEVTSKDIKDFLLGFPLMLLIYFVYMTWYLVFYSEGKYRFKIFYFMYFIIWTLSLIVLTMFDETLLGGNMALFGIFLIVSIINLVIVCFQSDKSIKTSKI